MSNIIVQTKQKVHMLPGTVGFPGSASGKEPSCQGRRYKRRGFNPWGQEDSLEEGMATHSSILAWRISWTEEPGWLQSVELQRIGHTEAT